MGDPIVGVLSLSLPEDDVEDAVCQSTSVPFPFLSLICAQS